jgi:hypothetical protein
MVQRNSLPIPPPSRRPQSVDTELQQQLERQREEEAIQQAQISNEKEQQARLAQIKRDVEEEEDGSGDVDMANIRAQSKNAISNGKIALMNTNIGVNLTTNPISLVTIIGPIIGIFFFAAAGFFKIKTSWEINRIVKRNHTIPATRIKREIRKQILNTKNIIITSCVGCASTAVAGILLVFLAFIPITMAFDMVKKVSGTVVKAGSGIVDATKKAQEQSQQ